MSRFPHEQQRNEKDCGATCLRIIARHYGRSIQLNKLRHTSGTNREGTSLRGLSRAAEEIGFRTMAARVTLQKIRDEAPLPFILHWQQNHFVVVYKITKSTIYLSDPAQGLVSYPIDEFLRYWAGPHATEKSAEGVILLLEPTPAFHEREMEASDGADQHIKPFLLHYIRPHHRLLGQVLLSLLMGTVLQLILPFLTQNIVDTGIYKKDLTFIWLVLIAQLTLMIGQLFLELMRSWMLLFVSSRINISLIADYFGKLMRLPIRYFDTKLTGDLLQRINDHHRIQNFLTRSALGALFSVFTLLAYSIILGYYHIGLLAIFLGGSILYVGWIFFFLKKRSRLDYKTFQHASENNSKIYELVNGMQEIKLHRAELPKRWSWERIQIKLYRVSVQLLGLEQAQTIGARIINEIKNILITFLAAKFVIDGQISLGTMLAISYILGQLNAPVLQLVNVVKEWQDARISMDRLMDTYSEPDEANRIQNNSLLTLPVPADHTLSLEHVTFSYDELSDPVLKDVSLVVPHGKVTAIVGASGSGKTTLLKLLMRFYEPQKGTLSIGSEPLNLTDLDEWRRICGVVMQDGFLFNDTIAGNIAIGEEVFSIDRVRAACRMANIDAFIEHMPLKYETQIGQEGMGISGGQKQRILIARAVYKDPRILFFDEATSALDAHNEQEIMDKLNLFYQDKTVVIVAHRLSTVMHADNIIVLHEGEIIEEGSHDELSTQQGYYFHLVKNQLALGV